MRGGKDPKRAPGAGAASTPPHPQTCFPEATGGGGKERLISQSSNLLLICHGTLDKSLLNFEPQFPYLPNLNRIHAGFIC